jgi:hypothetical protein
LLTAIKVLKHLNFKQKLFALFLWPFCKYQGIWNYKILFSCM